MTPSKEWAARREETLSPEMEAYRTLPGLCQNINGPAVVLGSRVGSAQFKQSVHVIRPQPERNL